MGLYLVQGVYRGAVSLCIQAHWPPPGLKPAFKVFLEMLSFLFDFCIFSVMTLNTQAISSITTLLLPYSYLVTS